MADNKKTKGSLALGALAVAAGAAAGYYFYASKDAPKHRRIAASWAKGMKQRVVAEARKVGEIDKAKLAAIVDSAALAYRSAKDVDRRELARAAKELKLNWREIAQELQGKRGIKNAAKKAKKKAAKKSRAK